MSTFPASPQQEAGHREPKNGFGITALVLAIIGVVFGLIPITGFLAIILGALAVLFGLLGVGRVKRGAATNKVMSWFGTVLGAGALALGVWGTFIVVDTVEQFEQDMEQIEQDLDRDMQQFEQEMEQLDSGTP